MKVTIDFGESFEAAKFGDGAFLKRLLEFLLKYGPILLPIFLGDEKPGGGVSDKP